MKKIQAGYTVQPLSAFLKQPAPPAPPAIEWPAFTEDAFKTDFPRTSTSCCSSARAVPQEKALRARFAEIGIGPGKPFDVQDSLPLTRSEVGLGVKDGYETIEKRRDEIGKT